MLPARDKGMSGTVGTCGDGAPLSHKRLKLRIEAKLLIPLGLSRGKGGTTLVGAARGLKTPQKPPWLVQHVMDACGSAERAWTRLPAPVAPRASLGAMGSSAQPFIRSS